jgi:hypothetical protein
MLSKKRIARILESSHVGSCSVQRTRSGWVVRVIDSGCNRYQSNYLIPIRTLRRHHPRWLALRLIRATRNSLCERERMRVITGAEAWQLVCWINKGTVCHRPHRTAASKRREREWRPNPSDYSVSYSAERSRRGWVVRLGTDSGRLRGHYLVPFRGLRDYGRNWPGGPLSEAMHRMLSSLDGVKQIGIDEVASLLRWHDGSWHVERDGELKWGATPARPSGRAGAATGVSQPAGGTVREWTLIVPELALPFATPTPPPDSSSCRS